MRARLPSRALVALVLAVPGVEAWSGCSATQPTEIVPGALTQIEVPRDLAGIKVQVLANGATKFNQSYFANNGSVVLPATLGVLSGGSSSTTLTVIIGGYDALGVTLPNFSDNSQSVPELGAYGGPRVRRGSVLTYVDQHTLFLPMPLSYSCWDLQCADASETCKGAQCVTAATSSSTLVDFDPSLVDGSQDCFNPRACFPAAATVSAQPVDPATCTFTLPAGSRNIGGLNVRVFYQDEKLTKQAGKWSDPVLTPSSEQEILNVEPASALVEGFAIPDASQPTFQLAPGLCNLVHQIDSPPNAPPAGSMGTTESYNYHPVWNVQMSTVCPPKPPLLPFCSIDQDPVALTAEGGTTTDITCGEPVALEPAPSAVYLVMDNSSVMANAFGPSGYATDTGAALGNPVFKRTYVAFEFLDHASGDCTTLTGPFPYLTPGAPGVADSFDFELANLAQPTLLPVLLDPKAPDLPGGPFVPLDLLTALRTDDGAYPHLLSFESSLGEPVNVGAVMFFVNREPVSPGDAGAPDASAGVLSGADCPTTGGVDAMTAIENEAAMAAGKGVQTYFVVLSNNQGKASPLGFYQTVASDLAARGVSGVDAIDATEGSAMEGQVIGRIGTVAATFGTCLYELPPGLSTNATMSVTIPVPTPLSSMAPLSLTLPFDSHCSASTADTADGWNIDGSHVRVCGTQSGSQACSKLRNSVLAVAAAAFEKSEGGVPTVADVPVSVTMPCAPSPVDP